jgi:hypothetical protein
MGGAARLHEQEIVIPSRQWTKGRLYEVLTNRAYIGEHYFHKYEKPDGDARRMKPRQEWVPVKV